MLDVDLDAIARSSYAVQGSRDMIGTLQSMFQRRTRCEGLNAPVPPGSSETIVGLGKILCWGELPLIVRGDSVPLSLGGWILDQVVSLGLSSGRTCRWDCSRWT